MSVLTFLLGSEAASNNDNKNAGVDTNIRQLLGNPKITFVLGKPDVKFNLMIGGPASGKGT